MHRSSSSAYDDDTQTLDESRDRDSLTSSNGANCIIRDIPSPPARLTRETSAQSSLLAYYEAASQSYLDEDRHIQFMPVKEPDIPVTWRLKERMKTVSVALVLCLNIGTDPPDVVKTSPCARKECWFDPRTTSKQKATETIGQNLQAQYERWQARAKYKQALDPTMEDVKKLCSSLRRNAKTDRLLFHYNGHGVPRPTSSGEIWVFNKTYTQYIPLSIYDLRSWVGNPSIYVLDCSGAGVLLPHFLQHPVISSRQGGSSASLDPSSTASSQRDCIVLAPCAANELLPMNPAFPADLFTACLTTPILIALRWFITQNRLSMGDLDPDYVDHIPGKLSDRKTPLGELNWIFTAITDTIAWNTLPSSVFQRLFRQDLLVASLFRNFLLADRVLRSFGCTPASIPRLPSTAQHPLWQAWDLAAECCLSALISERNPSVNVNEMRLSAVPFFADQLTAFEVWLEFSGKEGKPPEQLPVVLQVLLSQAHRLRALQLLRRFLDLGPWAVNLALSVGIFPYVLKLLQSPANELRQVLVCIWARILAFDASCRTDLVKDNAYVYFITHLSGGDVQPEQRVMATFILTVIMDDHRPGQRDCLKKNVHRTCAQFLLSKETERMPVFRRWLCLALGKLCAEHHDARLACLREDIHLGLVMLLTSPYVEVRVAAIYALGTLFGILDASRSSSSSSAPQPPSLGSTTSLSSLNLSMSAADNIPGSPPSVSRQWSSSSSANGGDHEAKRRVDLSVMGIELLRAFDDASPMVRREAMLSLYLLLTDPLHFPYFSWVAHELILFNHEQQASSRSPPPDSQASSDGASNGTVSLGNTPDSLLGGPMAMSDPPDHDTSPPPSRTNGTSSSTPNGTGSRNGNGNGNGREGGMSAAQVEAKRSDWFMTLATRLTREGGDLAEHYLRVWLQVRQVANREPFPQVAEIATQMVQLVHENILDRPARQPPPCRPPAPSRSSHSLSSSSSSATLSNPQTPHHGPAYPPPPHPPSRPPYKPSGPPAPSMPSIPPIPPKIALERAVSATELRRPNVPSSALPPVPRPPGLTDPRRDSPHLPMAMFQAPLPPPLAPPPPPGLSAMAHEPTTPLVRHLSLAHKGNGSDAGPADAMAKLAESATNRLLKATYQESNLYTWSKRQFSAPAPSVSGDDDPLSREGELHLYRRTRNQRVLQEAEQLAAKCAAILGVVEEDPEWDGMDALLGIQSTPRGAASQRSQSLKLSQKAIFESEANMTCHLTFHPFEPLLVSADDACTVSVWNYEENRRVGHLQNGPPGKAGGRITTLGWINETGSSLLLTGADDGVIRLWKGVVDMPWSPPKLTTSFYAHALGGRGYVVSGSGLVTKWMAEKGVLITGGSSDRIRVWDMRKEQIVREWNTGGEACVTTLTASTPRVNYDSSRMAGRGQMPMTASTFVVAGFGDGKVKLYDMRTESAVAQMLEHKLGDWVVLADFVKGERELMTGTLGGDIKFWDLRRTSASLRTVDAGRGPMTAMAAHHTCPIMASGSYNQFIKVLTLDGETINVIRYHDGFLGQRIGPVAALAFHPCKLLLAAGAADSVISIYSPQALSLGKGDLIPNPQGGLHKPLLYRRDYFITDSRVSQKDLSSLMSIRM